MSYDFQYRASGKWILCGEHSVIRGAPAIAFPFKHKQLNLSYEHTKLPITAEFSGNAGEDLHLLFWSVIEKGLELLNINRSQITGHLKINNQLPIGTGLGASAALSVAVSQWLIHLQLLESSLCFEFSKQLENLFHKKSSGLDIACSMSEHGVLFQEGNITPLKPRWHPIWALSFSGSVGITSHCVKKVETLLRQSPALGAELDAQMGNSVHLAAKALSQSKSEQSFNMLQQAITQACDCFKQWQLINADVQSHLDLLTSKGAKAVKPTGSGSGGFVLSLWEHEPPEDLKEILIIV
jgi:mevalonate kinase